jgi:hypothetical protein
MSDPTRLSEEERARAALRQQAEAARRFDPAWSNEYGHDAYPVPQSDEPVLHRERLFSRKVLFGWALATFLLWFSIRFIVPSVLESVKQNVITSVRESTPTTDAPVITPALPALPAEPGPAALPAVPASPAAPNAPVLAPSAGHHITPPKPEAKSRH